MLSTTLSMRGAEGAPSTTIAPPLPAQNRGSSVARRDRMRHVALLIETSGSYGRGLLRGIAKYNRQHGNWSIYLRPLGLSDPPPSWLNDWDGDGIITRIASPQMAELAKSSRIPMVNVRGAATDMPVPTVTVDNAQVAKLAAEHLLERGLKHFGFCGQPVGVNSALDLRAEHFQKAIVRAGYKCDMYASRKSRGASWEDEQDNLARWIASLPRPCGVLACNDERGLQLLDACRRVGVQVPEEIAVVGVDNDVPLCELTIPPLTSIDVNAEAVGYQAASMLDRMMEGRSAPTTAVKLPPRGVVARRSTDVTASDDEDVCRALRFIEERACQGLQAAEVLAHLGMSRASLQQRMKAVTGRTIHREIQRVRLTRAKNLLASSDLTIKQVARESGFASVQYMTRVFRDLVGDTPAQYRRKRSV